MELVNPISLATFQELMEPNELRDFLNQVHQEMLRANHLIEQAHAAEDWPGLQKLAHRLKGSLGSVGCDASYAALHQLDEQLRGDPIQPPTAQQMTSLSSVITSTAQRLQEI